jgi:hypothetical protein
LAEYKDAKLPGIIEALGSGFSWVAAPKTQCRMKMGVAKKSYRRWVMAFGVVRYDF